MDVQRLEQLVRDLRFELPGLIATDIWEVESGKSLASYNTQPAAVDLFNKLTSILVEAIGGAGFPPLKRHYMVELEGATVVVIIHGPDIRQGMLIDTQKSTIGTVLTFGLKMALDGVSAARS